MILCLGTTPAAQRSMTFERLTLDAVNRSAQVHDYASGKSVNVARVLRTLGREPLACGLVGGERGEFLRRDLDAAGIRHEFVTVVAPTRQCITVIDRAAGAATELVEEPHHVEEAGWDGLDEKLRRLIPAARACVFSGTLAPGAPLDFYARWVRATTDAGAHAILDARGQPLALAFRHQRFTVKINREEFVSTFGVEVPNDAALAREMPRHAPVGGNLVTTIGAAGALATDGHSCWRIIVPPVKAISAVGSGDAFAAGLAAGLCDDMALPDACRLAAACGAANALTPHAGHVTSDDVERLTAQVIVRPL